MMQVVHYPRQLQLQNACQDCAHPSSAVCWSFYAVSACIYLTTLNTDTTLALTSVLIECMHDAACLHQPPHIALKVSTHLHMPVIALSYPLVLAMLHPQKLKHGRPFYLKEIDIDTRSWPSLQNQTIAKIV